MKNYYYSIFIILIAVACSTAKKGTKADPLALAPQWVKSTPIDRDYYHGIGIATKSSGSHDFREIARQNALSDIAGNISVNISSSSVLGQYEVDNQYSEYYKEKIKLSTQNYLEGYELIDSWENNDNFYVYYRLSKVTYERIKSERIQKALNQSEGNYREALAFDAKGNPLESIRFYIKAIESVKDFLGEDLRTDINGSNQSYTSHLMAGLTSSLQSIRIVYPVKSIDVMRGERPEYDPLDIQALDGMDNPLAGLAFISRFSFLPGKNIESVTGANGKFNLNIGPVETKNKNEYLTSIVDLEKLVKGNTSDQVIRKLLLNLAVHEYILPFQIISPKFYIETVEENMGDIIDKTDVKTELSKLLSKDGFEITAEHSVCDYKITVNATSSKGTEREGRFSASLNGSFVCNDQSGRTLYRKTISEITGLGSNYKDAGQDAFTALAGKIRINIYPEMYKQLFTR